MLLCYSFNKKGFDKRLLLCHVFKKSCSCAYVSTYTGSYNILLYMNIFLLLRLLSRSQNTSERVLPQLIFCIDSKSLRRTSR